jgi:benzoate 4-monooxygenase
MEPIIEEQLQILIHKLMGYSQRNEIFDLKACISCYILDILGEVAFSKSFDSQTSGKADAIPAINDHILMACLVGQLPFQAVSKAFIARSPIPRLRRLVKSRAQLKSFCAEWVHHRIQYPSNRHDLLQNLIEAKDPETGAQLTELDINTEAFAML